MTQYKVMINPKIARQLNLMTHTEKVLIRDAIDMMESLGQIGEPLFKTLNVWKYRCENLRILYKKTPSEILIFKILKGFDPTIA